MNLDPKPKPQPGKLSPRLSISYTIFTNCPFNLVSQRSRSHIFLPQTFQSNRPLDQLWPQMLLSLCQQPDPVKAVGDRLATTKQLAMIFDFVFHFDEAKMINPAIQNDFSYYRRVLGRMKDKKQKMKVCTTQKL